LPTFFFTPLSLHDALPIFLGRSVISNAAHLAGLFTGALLALVIDYRRPGSRASLTTAWRVLQVVCLLAIAFGAYKVVRNFNRPRSEEHTSELQSLTNLVCR